MADGLARYSAEFRFQGAEKLAQHHFGHAVKHALANAGQRAAELYVAAVAQDGVVGLFGQVNRAGTPDEALSALAVQDEFVVVRRLDVFKS